VYICRTYWDLICGEVSIKIVNSKISRQRSKIIISRGLQNIWKRQVVHISVTMQNEVLVKQVQTFLKKPKLRANLESN